MDRPIFFKTLILKGKDGAGVRSVEKTGTSGTVDTYTITFTDGNTATFTVTNGSSIDTIALTDTSGLVDTYTITLTDGSTSTFTVTNGESQTVPTDGILFYDGAGVPDGYEASDPPMAKNAVEMSYARYQTLTDAEKTNGAIYMVYDDPTDNYVANNGSYGIDYSFNEQPTGKKWVDGKPIYQKTLNPDITIGTTGQSVMDMTDVDTLIDVKPLLYKGGNQCQFPYSQNDAFTTWQVVTGRLLFYITSEHYNDAVLKYVTVQYTKTTD